mgnify:CR=1 FL=1
MSKPSAKHAWRATFYSLHKWESVQKRLAKDGNFMIMDYQEELRTEEEDESRQSAFSNSRTIKELMFT